MVRLAATQIESLSTQVINATRVLTARPRSKVSLENMDVFKEAWEKQVRLLTEAVDDITTIDDFLAVSGLCTLLSLYWLSMTSSPLMTSWLCQVSAHFSLSIGCR